MPNLYRKLEEKFIIISGSSLICQDSERVTSDIDLLLPYIFITYYGFSSTQSLDVIYWVGVIYSKVEKFEFSIESLKEAISKKTYKDLEPFTITIFNEINI